MPSYRNSPARDMIVTVGFIFTFVTVTVACVPPPSVDCNGSACEIFNYRGFWEGKSTACKAPEAVFPKTETELVDAVANAVRRRQKIRVVSRFSHSLSRLVCMDGEGVIISTRDFDSQIKVDKTAMTITVDAGVMMRDVIDAAAREGLALPAMIYWDGVSAAGVLATGAHGSGLMGRGSAVHEYVVGLRIVVPAKLPYGAKVLVLTEDQEMEFNAARLSLGVLGAISQVTFALQPMFKRSLSYSLEDDVGLEENIEDFLRKHEFGDVWWYPANAKVLYGKIDRVSVDVAGEGFNRMSQIGQPTTVANVQQSGAIFESIGLAQDSKKLCNLAKNGMISRVFTGGGFMNNEHGFTRYPVIGLNHQMQTTGGCQDYFHKQEPNPNVCMPYQILDKNQYICSWDRRVTGVKLFQVEIYVPLSKIKEAILDVKKIRDINPKSLCEIELIEGISMRSVKKSKAYLGHSEDVVTFQLQYSRSKDSQMPKWNMDVYEEIEQMLVEKHNGTLHWGKSGGFLFEGIAKRVVSLNKFLKVKVNMDANGLFSNNWSDKLFGTKGKRVEVLRDGCALEKLCKCKEDKHCSPNKGYLCRPGKVWKKAHVCRKDTSN